MDNMEIFEKNKVTIQSLNQKIDEMNMKEIFAGQVRTAVDMKKFKQNYDARLYSVRQTQEDRLRIDGLLSAINAGDFKVSEKEKAKLEAINGRNLSHIMLNAHKFTGDSEEMTRVKDALSNLEARMMLEIDGYNSKDAKYIIDLYHKAMDECQKYINAKHPKSETGKERKKMVQATLKRLMIEVDGIELGRRILAEKGSEAKEVKKGMDLLTLAAAQRLADRMEDKRVVDEKKELTASYELLKPQYDKSKAEYDSLLEKKTKKLSFAAKWSFNEDEDEQLKDLKAQLKLSEKKAEIDELDKKIKQLTTNQEIKTAAETKKKTEADKAFNESLVDSDKKINNLPPDLERLIRSVAEGVEPTSLIVNKNKLKTAEKKMLSEMLKIFDALKRFKTGSEEAKTIRVGGEFVCFSQDRYGNLSLKHNGESISFRNTASEVRDVIASDVITNWKIYGDEAVRNIIEVTKTDLSKMTRGDLQNTREYAVTVLFQLTGIPKTLLNNFTCGELKDLALEALALKDDNNEFKRFEQKIQKQAENKNTEKKEDQINTVVNLELQRVGFKQAEGIILNLEKQQDKSLWDKDERKVRDLAADLIFSRDTWVADGLVKKPEERIRHLLLENVEAVALIVADQFRDRIAQPDGIIERMIDKLPLAEMGAEQLRELKNSVKDALGKVRDMVNEKVEEELESKKLGGMKNIVKKGILTKFGLLPHIKKLLENPDKELLKKMKGIDSAIDEAVEQNMQEVQNTFDDCVDEMFSKDDAGAVYEPELTDGLDELENEQYEELVEKENKFEAARNKRLENKRKGAVEEDENKDNEENEENLKLNRFERARKKRLQSKRDAALADKADRKILDEKRSEAKAMQETIAAMHREIDQRKKAVDELLEESAKNKEGQTEENRLLIRKYNDEINNLQEAVDELNRNLAGNFDEVTKTINAYSKRINIREINRRMYKRKEGEEILREEIMKNECDIEKAEEKIKKLEKEKNEEIKSANDRGRVMSDGEIAAYDNEIGDLRVLIGRYRNEIRTNERSLKDFENAMPKDSAKELDKIIENAAKGGEKGQSLFMKNVFKTYFKSVPVLDKRSMLASAFRNSDPVPSMTEEERENLSKEQKLSAMSGFLGGMFKGAGPLFQKMLQGLPKSGLPDGLKKAVEDTQDSLASIPDEVVMAHLDAIKKRSNKQITKIEVKKSLGAASVGQAFLCTIYGPKMKEGKKDVVIKLLRPDVRNRMMREKDVMLEAARMTDAEGKTRNEVEEMRRKGQKGGMEATYLGNLQRIEEELDLTIEAQNCKEGQIYDKALEGKENLCDSMKLSDIVSPTTDTCMMEIAGKQTVKRYMNGIEEKMQELLGEFCIQENEKDKNGNETGKKIPKKNKDGSYVLKTNLKPDQLEKLEQVQKELGEMLKDAELRTSALAQLAEKWVTQGVFEKGYYHGDLHAGNIMISDKGVTVIDFGNATMLTSQQQKHITKMMIAATMGDVERFRHGFHQLLENTPEEVYQEKREELTLLFKEIMSMGDEKKPAERIAAALIRAQELGLELPPTIANFSSCQMRMQNTLDNMNNTLLALRNNVSQLSGEFACTEKYVKKDPVAKYKTEYRKRAAYYRKQEARRYLVERECPSEEFFKELIRDKRYRAFVTDNLGFRPVAQEDLLEEELKKIDDLLSGKRNLEKAELEGFPDDAFNELDAIKEANKDNAARSDLVKYILDALETIFVNLPDYDDASRNLTLATDPVLKGGVPKSLNELKERIKKAHPECENAELVAESKEADRKLREYYDAVDGGTVLPDDLQTMEDALYQQYLKDIVPQKQKEFEKDKDEWKQDLLSFLPEIKKDDRRDAQQQLLMSRANQLDIIENMILSCADNKLNGEELKKEGAELKKLWQEATKNEESLNNNMEALTKQYEKVLDLLWLGQIQTFKEIEAGIDENADNKEKIEVSDEEPDSFLCIMGGVLKKKRKDMLLRLDPTTSVKLLWKMYKEKED